MIITSIDCDQTDGPIACVFSINSNVTTYYLQIYLSPIGNVKGIPEAYTSRQGLRAKITPFYDYILDSFLTNYFGVNAIMMNNTFLLASPYTNDNISWSLLTIPLPTHFNIRYDNSLIDNTIPSINDKVSSSTTLLIINFKVRIALSTSTSRITIYKTSDNSIRQRIPVTMHEYFSISPDEFAISIFVINSTFNEYDEQYFVNMDNNFVKNKVNNEPIKGIHDDIWILKTDLPNNRKLYSDNAIMGSVRLTQSASKSFLALSKHNQSTYINNLLNELAEKVPINISYLRSDNGFNKITCYQIVIPIRIDVDSTNYKTKRTASEYSSDLHYMITYKNITTFTLGITNDLDQDYGFKPMWNVWNDHKVQIILISGIIIFITFCLLYPILIHKLKSKKIEVLCSTILKFALIVPNFILSILFVVQYSNNVPDLYWLSVLVLNVPLFINFFIATYTIYVGIKNPFIGKDFKEWIIKYRGLVIILIVLVATDYEYLTILKEIPIFTKKLYYYEQINIFNILDNIFDIAILWGAFFDIFFRNIPQIIIQVYYYNYEFLLEYDIVPLLLFVTSSLKIFMIIFNYIYKKVTLIIVRRLV
ncbi:hypothetical protein F8M41_020002 [Gigaspora margarita]|uniref:Uncharacterized protein n=1 Tax=Gigaspora margarita TaxID=4874 RepID=A0A8H4AJ21_GIGMA|nr:hypothetical protein F8M41_020002 [Gigaspora margarita]